MTQPKRTNRFTDEVRLAASLSPTLPKGLPVAQTTATADSSGFVDLSDFSETDGDWVDRALAQARTGARGVPPSLAPIAIETLVAPTATTQRRDASALGAIVFVAVCVTVAAAGVASAVLVLRARHEKAETATAQLAAMTWTAPSATPDASADSPTPVAAAPSDSAPSTIATYAPPPRAVAAKRPAGGSGGSLDDLIRRAAQSKGGH